VAALVVLGVALVRPVVHDGFGAARAGPPDRLPGPRAPARHRLPVPALARWLLALGIVATLAANVAHGWPNGPVGAVVAAWPAASLVGSYELLLWLIRTAAGASAGSGPSADQSESQTGQPPAELRLVSPSVQGIRVPAHAGQPGPARATDHDAEPGRTEPDHAPQRAIWSTESQAEVTALVGERDADEAAVAAYQFSLDIGRPLSERKLAAMFGKTSRRWARHRMAEARAWVA
jgi:hypothetical protein